MDAETLYLLAKIQGGPVTVLSSPGAPTSGTWFTGSLVLDSVGVLWVCESGGAPGTWVIVGALSKTSQDNAITTANTWQTIATLSPSANGLYRVGACFDVASGTPTVGVQATYADANGAQTITLAPVGSALSAGTWSSLFALISAHTGTAINLQVQASTTTSITASGYIESAQ